MEDAAERSIGPYRVIRPLGRGGMGEVFLAYDPRLDRQVAIKRIRPGSDDPARRARFLREARLTAALCHPCIVQVFDLPSDEGADHIVMEYVPGTSLHGLLRQGPLPSQDGLRIAAAVAEGLAYAHGRGVVHRDLKAENVLVTPDGEVKIADFGLARRSAVATDAGDESLTQEGVVVGTYRVMSPEQACGEPPDSRTDLFSFGVLLYELFTGRSPFLADTPSATVQRILAHRPKPLREIDPSLPPELSDIVEHLLEKDPALRPWDAGEVAGRLRALAGFSGSGSSGEATIVSAAAAVPARTPHPVSPALPEGSFAWGKGRRLGWAGLATLAAGAVLLATFLAYVLRRPASSPSPAPAAGSPLHVAVLAPALRGGRADPEMDYLAFALRGALQSTLTSFVEVYPKSASEVDAVPGPPAAVARAVAADEVLETTFACRGASCSVDVGRLRGSDGGATWSGQVEVPLDDVLTATRAVRVLLRQAYAERRLRQGAPEVRATPADYAEYLRLKQAMVRGTAGTAADVLARLARIRQRSPRFVDAYVFEAQLLLNEFSSKSRDPALAGRALTLIDQARSLAPGDLEVAFVRAEAERTAGRLDEAETTLAELEAQAPGDVRVLDQRAALLEQRGQPAAALAIARTAVERQPSWWRLYEYAKLAWRQGEIATARQTLEQLFARSPGNPWGKRMLATLELTNGDPARAVRLYEEIGAGSSDPGTQVNLGLARLLTGDPAGAARAFEKAVAAAPTNYLFLLNLAQARLLQRRQAEAVALFRRVLELSDRDPERDDPQRLTVRAQALAHLGREEEAVQEIQEALRLAPRSGSVAFEAALVYAVVGDRTAALVNAKRARSLGFEAPAWFRLPWFAPLRDEPAFRDLIGD